MISPDDARAKAASTYNAASDVFDDAANSFWERFGRRTIERLALPAGARVLDVCCGTGASALPAAEHVGPDGRVLGVDLAEKLLALARSKARQRGLANAEFRTGDMLALDLPEAPFDAVVCVFGIFFVPDMQAAVRSLWRQVRPGGQLAITTWGPRWFEPASTSFWEAVRAVRPDLHKGFNPWDRISEPAALRALFAETDAESLEVVAEAGRHVLRRPEPIALGTGYRGTLEQLDAASRAKVLGDTVAFIRRTGVEAIEANVVYAVARKRSGREAC